MVRADQIGKFQIIYASNPEGHLLFFVGGSNFHRQVDRNPKRGYSRPRAFFEKCLFAGWFGYN
jgi:hypothetical protein